MTPPKTLRIKTAEVGLGCTLGYGLQVLKNDTTVFRVIPGLTRDVTVWAISEKTIFSYFSQGWANFCLGKNQFFLSKIALGIGVYSLYTEALFIGVFGSVSKTLKYL